MFHSFSIKISSINNIFSFIDEIENIFNDVFELSNVQMLFNVGKIFLYEIKKINF